MERELQSLQRKNIDELDFMIKKGCNGDSLPIHLDLSSYVGRTALCCYSVITVSTGFIPFLKWEEMVVESGYKKSFLSEQTGFEACSVQIVFIYSLGQIGIS